MPLTVRVRVEEPATTELGVRLVIVGAELVTESGAAADVPPAVLTVTRALPAVETSAAGTAAVSCALLTKVVVSGVDPNLTDARETKFLPLIVIVKAWPALTDAGLRLVIEGGGYVIVNAAADEAPEAAVTVMPAVPGVAIRLEGTAAVSWAALT